MIKARIITTLKKGVLDPQGQAIKNSLNSLGFNKIDYITQGKVFDISLDEDCPDKAKEILHSICETLLVNNVIEDYSIEL
ncbi:phosphoribosylformylglycinamidine synthase subunit PurS [Bartonella sp. DGB1]|uniref:phosphoribosylformylglycinamidine synthase subunit PurS n=1 Tax=Bartonella sp. DGB1 TaxID=3239807 RepID=UPI0035237D62